MRPVPNKRTVTTYHAPLEKSVAPSEHRIGDLVCERVKPGVIRSFWKPTDEELHVLAGGGVLELVILGEPIPPVALNIVTESEAEQPWPES
jgi:hypothetical protein